MYTPIQKVVDGTLAGASAFGSSTVLSDVVSTQPDQFNIWTAIIIPIVTGVLMPFLKDWLIRKGAKGSSK